MATIISAITNGSVVYLITSGSPNSGGGTDANIGSSATDKNTGDLYTKIGSGLSDWMLLVFATSPTFTTNITTPLIYGSSASGGTLTLQSTSNATKGVIQIGTTDLVNIGNAVTTSQRLVRIGQDTAWIDIGSQSGSTARPAIYLNTTTPDTTNYALSSHQTAGQTYLNGKNGVNFLANGGIIATWIASQAAFLVQPANGNTINYQFTVPNNTALTASTEVPIFKIIGGNNTWNTGAITNQKWSWITANTANFSAASIITNSYGLFVEAATAGTNATITNNYAIGTNGNIAIQSATATVSAPIGTLTLYGNSQTILNTSGVSNIICDYYKIQFNGSPIASGGHTIYTFNAASYTNQTASANLPNFRINGSNKQWATGTVANQYWNYLTANTAAFVAASTMTNSYGLFVEAATAGTNATITNNYAAGFSGRVGQYGLGNSTYFGDLCGVKDDIANRQNTAFGAQAANKVASGGLNIAMGYQSLFTNVVGNNNVAIGGFTLYQATSNSNVAVGGYALFNVTTGQSNVAIGYDTGGGVTIGSNNVFIGNGITGLSSSLNNNIILATNLGVERFRYNPSQGSASLFSFSAASTTANVASTEINMFRVNTATTTILTGALTTQRFTYLPSQTLAFAGASTATNVFGLYVEAATAGTNATITNNYSLGTDGKAKFGGNIELTQTVTTEALTTDTSVTIVINGVTYKLLAKA